MKTFNSFEAAFAGYQGTTTMEEEVDEALMLLAFERYGEAREKFGKVLESDRATANELRIALVHILAMEELSNSHFVVTLRQIIGKRTLDERDASSQRWAQRALLRELRERHYHSKKEKWVKGSTERLAREIEVLENRVFRVVS